MGLELVELAMTVEEEFDISISDAILESIATPQDYADYIYKEYQKKDSLKCSSQIGFYKIRKLFMKEFNCKREELTPDTKLEEIFSENIREDWVKLNRLLDNKLKYYSLKLSSLWQISAFFISVLPGIIFKSGFFFFLIWAILFIVFRYFFASKPPASVDKLSSLIKFVGESNARSKYNTKEKILHKIIEISIVVLEVSASEISSKSRYAQDFGVEL